MSLQGMRRAENVSNAGFPGGTYGTRPLLLPVSLAPQKQQ